MVDKASEQSRFSVWMNAARPRTLPLAVASIIMGTALAIAGGTFKPYVALFCILTAIFLQILSNLANDYGDSLHGADHVERRGPRRAVQSGLVTPGAMKRAIAITVTLSIISGLILLWLAFGRDAFSFVLLFILLGAAAIVAAITYTAGKLPYGYAGLGDIAVLIFFGWVGVLGSYFAQIPSLEWRLLLPATACGLLAVAVLNVNNIRDLESDRQAGKHSIPVRLGLDRARLYHWILLILAPVLTVAYVLLTFSSWWQFLFLLAIPFLIRNGLAINQTDDLPSLNPWLKQMSLATLVFVLLFSAGQVLPVWLGLS
jgi:1,4-dihydroxy-2-naphthoate octaprenyltransferase